MQCHKFLSVFKCGIFEISFLIVTYQVLISLYQIDLTHEAENLLQFGKDFSRDSRVIFPIPLLELCHPNVIVETYEYGVPLSCVVNRMDEMPTEARKAVANAGVEMLLKMVRTSDILSQNRFLLKMDT